jgi:hypothetical protein
LSRFLSDPELLFDAAVDAARTMFPTIGASFRCIAACGLAPGRTRDASQARTAARDGDRPTAEV